VPPKAFLETDQHLPKEKVMPKRYSIVGMEHAKSNDIVVGLKPGTDVTLLREPGNPFDPLAVSVWVEGRRIGYVPKKQNSLLSHQIDAAGTEMALDAKNAGKSIPAKFVRSPNSGYPMVEVPE
jgi:hypothetical protein